MRLKTLADYFNVSLISIHAPLTGCDIVYKVDCARYRISIHAPLTGCDFKLNCERGIQDISIHAPLTGCDSDVCFINLNPIIYFNPRTPYGMRLNFINPSIQTKEFQSTHPLRDATECSRRGFTIKRISIHAPLTGCDGRSFITIGKITNFNPRTPYGMRHNKSDVNTMTQAISIHAPLTGCDPSASAVCTYPLNISIHAPLTGCDYMILSSAKSPTYFNPRTPYGMRPNIII